MAGLISNIGELIRLFGDVATASANPIPAILLLFGAIFVGFSVLLGIYLVIGAIGGVITADSPGQAPPQ